MRSLKRQLKTLLVGLLVIGLTYAIDYASKQTLNKSARDTSSYLVTQVFDGDTIEVFMDGRYESIRLIGVDTPEVGNHDTVIECYGPEASTFTKSILLGERVILTADSRSSNRDIYDRLLRYVARARDGYDLNKELVLQGYSDAYSVFPHNRSDEFRQAASAAQNQNRGLWSACAD